MTERSGATPVWTLIVAAVIVIGIILTGYLMVQTQERLETAQGERDSAKQEAVQVNAQVSELEKTIAYLKSQLDESKAAVSSLEDQVAGLKSDLEKSNTELGEAKSGLAAAQSELDGAKEAAETAQTKLDEFSSTLAAPTGGGDAAAAEMMTPLERALNTPKGQLKSPYPDFASVAEKGYRKYMAAGCNGCHGGGGGGGMAMALTNQVWIYGDDDDTLFRVIALGTGKLSPDDAFRKLGYQRKRKEGVVGPMPPFGEIIKTDDDLWKIIAWIRSIYCERRAAGC